MFGAELAYVRAQLLKLTPSQRREVAAAIKVNPVTLKRLARKETKFGRTDTIGNLSMYFRTREKRGK